MATWRQHNARAKRARKTKRRTGHCTWLAGPYLSGKLIIQQAAAILAVGEDPGRGHQHMSVGGRTCRRDAAARPVNRHGSAMLEFAFCSRLSDTARVFKGTYDSNGAADRARVRRICAVDNGLATWRMRDGGDRKGTKMYVRTALNHCEGQSEERRPML
ncbi:hypothetical protein IWZ03DRAFT_135439 [Phyllosticta citriasiana]|uniref:Uncharacterized protein n=1 Tax=Phyllosticta citriasiana TaxID=595635 RepID=A0ABR1KWU2_9PEZI